MIITRTIRLERGTPGELRHGIAGTWERCKQDGYKVVRGAFESLCRAVTEAAPLPALWLHGRALPPIAAIHRLSEESDGFHFWYQFHDDEFARRVEGCVDAGTANDASISINAFEVDVDAPLDIVRAGLDEISICTTGFGADKGSNVDRLQRLGMWDAMDVLESINGLRSQVERFEMALATITDQGFDWGTPVSEELETAITDEATLAAAYVVEKLNSMMGGNDT